MANRRRADSADPAGAGANRDRARRIRFRPWQAQESPCLGGDVVEIGQAASLANDVEQIAMLARGGVGPLAGRALPDSLPSNRTNMDRPGVFLTSPTSQ